MAGKSNPVDRLLVKIIKLDEEHKARVTPLQEQIRKIQRKCIHSFKQVTKLNLVQSLVPNVYVGQTADSIGLGQSTLIFHTICTKCRVPMRSSLRETCPHCFVEMKNGRCLGAGSRLKYFGEEHLYYGVAIDTCPQCGFAVASDIWDR